LGKTPGQVLIRWSVQHGFITIPTTSKKSRLQSNADEDMKVLVSNKHWLKFILFSIYFTYRMHSVINHGLAHGIQQTTL